MRVKINTDLKLNKNILRVNPKLTISGLLHIIRNYLENPLQANEALYAFINGKLLPMSTFLYDIKDEGEDDILEIDIMKEDTFGCAVGKYPHHPSSFKMF